MMPLFGPPKDDDYPRRWKDMSLDFKLMFVYHGGMMVLFATGGAFTVRQEVSIVAVLATVLTSISMRNRRAARWRWPGVGLKSILSAIGGIVLTGVFLFAATPLFPPSNPRCLPWFFAGFGIGVFNCLRTLRLVHATETAFRASCGERSPANFHAAELESDSPVWQGIVRATYSAAFLIVWLGFVAFFYYSGSAIRDGSPVRTGTKTEPVTEHGKTVYITQAEKALSDRLELFASAGIPSVIVGGLVLHFVIGVKLFPNVPTRSGQTQ